MMIMLRDVMMILYSYVLYLLDKWIRTKPLFLNYTHKITRN